MVSIVDILSGASPLMVDVRQTGSGPVPLEGASRAGLRGRKRLGAGGGPEAALGAGLPR